MLLREDLDLLVLGAREAVYALDLKDISKRVASVRTFEQWIGGYMDTSNIKYIGTAICLLFVFITNCHVCVRSKCLCPPASHRLVQ